MHSWLVSTLGVAFLLAAPPCQAQGPTRPPRQPLHDGLQNIQLRDSNVEFFTDWVGHAYLECLEQDFFQTHLSESERKQNRFRKSRRVWEKIEEECYKYAKVVVAKEDGTKFTVPVTRVKEMPKTPEELRAKQKVIWSDNDGTFHRQADTDSLPRKASRARASQQVKDRTDNMPFSDTVRDVRDSFFRYMDGRPDGATDDRSQRGVNPGAWNRPVYAPKGRPMGF